MNLTYPLRYQTLIPGSLKKDTVKFRKQARGLYFSKALFEGLIYGGKFAFQNDRVSLIVGSKFTVFALFYFVCEGNFPSTSPREAYIWRCDLTEGFFALPGLGGLYLEGLIFGILRYPETGEWLKFNLS